MAASGAEGTIENSSGSCSGRSKLFYDLNNHHSLKGLIAYHYSRRTDIDVKSANKLVLDAGSEEVIDPNAIAFFLSQSEFACESNCLESAQTIQWISFSSQDIRNSVAAIDLQRGKTADHMAHLRKCLSVLDLHLKLKTYLVGEQVTLADVCVMVDLLPAFRSPSIMNPSAKADLPHVTRWFNTIINQRLVKETIETYGFDSTAASKLPNPSKKARSKTQDTNESSKRTEKQVLRILCVHGYRQTGKSFREKLGAFRKLLGKRTELVFITAPHIVPSLGEGDDIDQTGWWFSRQDDFFDAHENSQCDKGFAESLRTVEEAFKTQGPFHGILGFSQGASLVAMLCLLQEKKKLSYSFNFAILVAAFRSRSIQHCELFDGSVLVKIPTLHVIGDTDKVIEKEMSEDILPIFSDKEVLNHPGGHFIPATGKQKQIYIQFLERVKDMD